MVSDIRKGHYADKFFFFVYSDLSFCGLSLIQVNADPVGYKNNLVYGNRSDIT